MQSETLNICQVSLKRDIPLIIKNYKNFIKFYKNIKIYIICPAKEIYDFKSKLKFKEFEIIEEESLISFQKFLNIFKDLSNMINYKDDFKNRISWYYQQILKISFVFQFIENYKKNIIIWDADTILIKKINFFKNNVSIQYGNFNEFHNQYFITNKKILGSTLKYHISFLNQFIAVSTKEMSFLKKKIFNNELINTTDIPSELSKLILKSIFTEHPIYNGSMFSEYELIGQSNYLLNNNKQIPVLSLRFGLDGVLTNGQINLIKYLNFIHITYEHAHLNKNSQGMLNRKQKWSTFIKLLFKNIFKFYLRLIKHNYKYFITKNEKN